MCKIPRYDGPALTMSREVDGLSEAVCSVGICSAGKTSELHPFTFFTFREKSNNLGKMTDSIFHHYYHH